FHKWLTLTIGFLMQPVLLALFLMMMVSAFEQVICKQPFSVVASMNALKGGRINLETQTNNGVATRVAKSTPRAGTDYGAAFCTREAVQASAKGLVDEITHTVKSQVIPGSTDLSANKDYMEGATSILQTLGDTFSM